MRDAALRCPECEAIVERTRILVLELHGPGRAAIDRFVNSEICRVATDTDRLQIRDVGAHTFYIAELQQFGSRYHTGLPGIAAVGCNHERARASGSPDHLRVHRTDRNQSVRRTAVLRSQGGLLIFWGLCGRRDRESEGGNKESSQQTFQHSSSSKGKFVRQYRISPRRTSKSATTSEDEIGRAHV